MEFYDETKPLYIGEDVYRIGLGAALLQTRSNTGFLRDEAPVNSIIRTIAFASK